MQSTSRSPVKVYAALGRVFKMLSGCARPRAQRRSFAALARKLRTTLVLAGVAVAEDGHTPYFEDTPGGQFENGCLAKLLRLVCDTAALRSQVTTYALEEIHTADH